MTWPDPPPPPPKKVWPDDGALAPDEICRCGHFLAVPGGHGHAGNPNAKCTNRSCGCRSFQKRVYTPFPSYPPGDPNEHRRTA